jgi:hypothetical protein
MRKRGKIVNLGKVRTAKEAEEHKALMAPGPEGRARRRELIEAEKQLRAAAEAGNPAARAAINSAWDKVPPESRDLFRLLGMGPV